MVRSPGYQYQQDEIARRFRVDRVMRRAGTAGRLRRGNCALALEVPECHDAD
jgi:hypothetical protein